MVGEILERLPLDGSLSGILFPSHGALEVEFIGSGDAFLISMLRERVGPRVPIALALDLHANNTYTLARLSNIIYGYRTAPHIDIAETSIRAAKLLIKAIEEGKEPWTELVRLLYDAGRKHDDGIRIRKRSDLHGGGFRARSGCLVFLVFRRNAMGGLRAGRLLHRDLGSGG